MLSLKVKMYMRTGMSELDAYKKVLGEAQSTIKNLDTLLAEFVAKVPTELVTEIIGDVGG